MELKKESPLNNNDTTLFLRNKIRRIIMYTSSSSSASSSARPSFSPPLSPRAQTYAAPVTKKGVSTIKQMPQDVQEKIQLQCLSTDELKSLKEAVNVKDLFDDCFFGSDSDRKLAQSSLLHLCKGDYLF